MKKISTILAATAAAAILAVPGLHAAEGPVVSVDVPFSFVVGDQQLPSGEYRIVRESGSAVLRLCSKDMKHQVATFYVPSLSSVKAGSELEFHSHGDRRFLKGIQAAGGFGAYIPDSQTEREAGHAASAGMP